MTDEVSNKDGQQGEDGQKEGVFRRMFRRRDNEAGVAPVAEPEAEPTLSKTPDSEEESDAIFWQRMRKGLGITLYNFGMGLSDFLEVVKEIDYEIFEEC